MEEKQLHQLIDKYLSGKCSAQEKRLIEEWYAAFDHERDSFYGNDPHMLEQTERRSIHQILAKIGALEKNPHKDGKITEVKLRRMYPYRWLAAASLLLFLSITIWFLTNRKSNKDIYYTRTAMNGRVTMVVLPDSTRVWLNGGSFLKFSSSYNVKNREVYLQGEAYFDVVHDIEKPFNVYSGKVSTHVLGTAFLVNAYKGALEQTVTVTRGKVGVAADGHSIGTLLPNDQVIYQSATGKSAIVKVDAIKETAWQNGALIFNNLSLQDIGLRLSAKFNYQVVIKSEKLKTARFTASFDEGTTLKEVLTIMGAMKHLRYRLDNRTNVITFL
ncbi:FecR family protein [Mucilaginibacter terrae]|uniref:FecR family protein n=1 Tax=Mucilaginibacter terrae TaxID=1955052 RepID=UPI003636772E